MIGNFKSLKLNPTTMSNLKLNDRCYRVAFLSVLLHFSSPSRGINICLIQNKVSGKIRSFFKQNVEAISCLFDKNIPSSWNIKKKGKREDLEMLN